MSPRLYPLAERFWVRVEKADGDGCWLWKGHRVKQYGKLDLAKGEPDRPRRAHRLSYVLNVGPIPDGMLVCHRCDVPLCVRPDHLFLGTPTDNIHDMMAKGRRGPVGSKFQTHCKRGHPFSGPNHYRNRLGHSRCRACARIRDEKRER